MKKTNRTFKRFAAITSASLLAACALMPAVSFADATTPTTGSITISNTVAGHTYEAYQIFDGDLGSDNKTLSNIAWGAGIKDSAKLAEGTEHTAFISALQNAHADFASKTKASEFATALTTGDESQKKAKAIAFANVIGNYLGTAAASDDYDENKYEIAGLDPGYYLVKDKDNSLAGKDEAYTNYIVKVLGTESNIAPKSSKPSVVKKVKENKTIDGLVYNGDVGYNDVADYSVGDSVPFKIYGTMPSDLAGYEHYYMKFTDTLGSEFKAPAASAVTVKIDGDPVTVDNKNCRVKIDGNDIIVSFEDIIELGAEAGSSVTIEYNAELTAAADIGLPGQVNEVYLEYSNNPNSVYNPTVSDDIENTPNDGLEDNPETEDIKENEGNTGKTDKDKVIVLTYELDVTKVDGTDNTTKLANAEFVLRDAETNGKYAMVDTSGVFRGWTENKDITGINVDGETVTVTTKLTSDTNGLFKISGIDEGTYYLEETKAPDKYNILGAPVTVVITADTLDDTGENRQNWTWANEPSGQGTTVLQALTVKANTDDGVGDVNAGIASISIENNKGNELPGTGGIGTTIFYLGGGAMAAIGGIYLISKRRMKKSEE